MKSLSKTALIALGLSVSTELADAKVRPVLTPNTPAVGADQSPRVEASSAACQENCLFKDDNNEWCFSTTPPILTAGWDWEQTAADTYYAIKLAPYLQTQLQIRSNFALKRLVNSDFDIDINKFKASIWYSALFSTKGEFCFGFGYSTDQIELNLRTSFTPMDCYKTIIEDVAAPLETWYSKEALFIDECNTSDAGGTVTLKKWVLSPAVSTRGSVLGGERPGGAGCFKFADWTRWAPYVAQVGLDVAESLGVTLDPTVADNIKSYAASSV